MVEVDINMQPMSFGRILILSQQSKLYKRARQHDIVTLSIFHSNVLLFLVEILK
jgi:hypothetical protein